MDFPTVTSESQRRSRRPNINKGKATQKAEESDDEGLCFICTEPVATFAVSSCDHRTCHKCTLRLRALYETRQCAYCKAEQKVVIFTKDATKPFEDYVDNDTPHVDKKLSIKFETQDMYKDAKHMLDFNCPQKECKEVFKNWGELKQHVRKAHSLNICDLCSRHKKVFPFEHILYTSAQLTKHHREGDKEINPDDETGFSGHPECAFCKTRFYGNDELYVHCRDQHEQCFLCVRQGAQHQYYVNYSSLEDHFKKDHHMCMYPTCLEKKFVVYDSVIDLKDHLVKVHGEAEARRLEVNFQYESYRPQQRGNSSSSSSSSSSRRTENDRKKKEKATAIDPAEFPAVNATVERNVPGASTKKSKGKGALQKPAGFGSLSQPSTSTADPVVANHTAFLTKIQELLKTPENVSQFRALTGSYRKNTLTADEYVAKIVQLTNNNIEHSSKIFKGVEELMDIDEKKWELVRAWRNKHTAMSQFPALDIKKKKAEPTAKRVMVIKPKQTGGASSSKTVWNNSTSSRTSSTHSSPQSSRPSSPVFRTPSKTPWSNGSSGNDFPAIEQPQQSLFPSLPSAAPKHQAILNMRKTTPASAWGSNSSNSESESVEEGDMKKKKGRKNKVLFRVGL